MVRAIHVMRGSLGDPLPLAAIASAAAMSKYHFARVFRQLTGLPPQHFLAALRLDEALRLLTTTEARITDICFSVGYSSHGTFTREFTKYVGVSPRRVRSLVRGQSLDEHSVDDIRESDRADLTHVDVSLRGRTPEAAVLVGAFPGPMPTGLPIACAVTHSDRTCLDGVPPGRHFILAVEIPALTLVATPCNHRYLRVGAYERNPLVVDPYVRCHVEVPLRSVAPTDPPVLSFLPLLLRRYARMQPSKRWPLAST